MNKYQDAVAIAEKIRDRKITAREIIEQTLEKITQRNDKLNCFTTVTKEKAIAQAIEIDRLIAQSRDPGILAGVPFAVKNLFDIEGIVTLAGSKINQDNPPATENATAITKLQNAGAILVGALNMDEYAYGFVTENSHYGATPNPHDPDRIVGGSSGGSAAAVAADLVPLTLGSDTNGSIRVPAALAGVYGFKPTYGRLSRRGTFLFASSLDHIGPFAHSVRDIATAFDLLQGADQRDPVCTTKPIQPCLPKLNQGIDDLRIAIADEYFTSGATTEALSAVEKIAHKLQVTQTITIAESDRAKAAAYIITAVEGANLHLKNLRSRPQDFDPATRDRFLAGALIPASWYLQAQRFRAWYRRQMQTIFQQVDIILAPTTPCAAPLLGQEKIAIAGEEILVRPHLGRFTQPLSFIGLPVLSIPVKEPEKLPLGVQIIAAPYNEALILRVAAALENSEP